MNSLAKTLIIGLSSLVLVTGAACSSDNGEPGTGTSGAVEQEDASSDSTKSPESPQSEASSDKPEGGTESAKVIDTDFRPAKLVISAGTAVSWEQVGDQPHSVSSNDELFESSPDCSPTASDMCLGEGDVFEFTFDDPGTYKYYCRVHGLPDGTGMTGTVVVE